MFTKRGLKLLAVVAVLSLVLAACGEGGTGDTTTTAGGEEEPTTTAGGEEETTTTAGEEPVEPGELGVVEVAAGAPIQIRSIEAISGEVAFLGIPNQRATEMAIEDYGQILGHDVTIGTPLDGLCSNEGGQAAAQQVVADPAVVGAIGTSCSGAGVPASALITDAGMVLVSASNTAPALTSDLEGTAGTDYNPGYYRTSHNDLYQGRAVADFVFNELGLTQMAAIHDGDPYTDGLATAFSDAFELLGGEIVVYTAVSPDDTDMVPVLTEVAAGEPEGIYFPIFPPAGNFIAQQVGDVPGLEDVTLIAADGLQVENFLEIPESEGMYFSGPSLAFEDNANELTGVSADDFLATYEETFGEAPSAAFWAHAYDATTLLLSSIAEVAVENDDGSLTIDRAALRDALNQNSFAGMIGQIDCDDFGDCGPGAVAIVTHPDSSITDSTQLEVVFSFTPER